MGSERNEDDPETFQDEDVISNDGSSGSSKKKSKKRDKLRKKHSELSSDDDDEVAGERKEKKKKSKRDKKSKKDKKDSGKYCSSSEEDEPPEVPDSSKLEQLEADVVAKQRGRSDAAAVKPGAYSEGGASTAAATATDSLSALERDVVTKTRLRESASGAPTLPGAHAVSNSCSALERDVASKTRLRASASAAPSLPGAHAVSNGSTASDAVSMKVRREGSSSSSSAAAGAGAGQTPSALGNLEADIAAKTRAAPPSAAAASRPGVYAVSNSDPESVAASLDRRVQAKIRGESSSGNAAGTSTSQQHLSTLEDRVAAKVRAGSSSAAVPGARAQLNQLEDSVSAKVRASSTSCRPGAHAEKLTKLEDRVSAKVRSSGAAPGAQAALNSLEDSVAAKVRGSSSPGAAQAPSGLQSLEDRVAAKVRGETPSSSSNAGAQMQLESLEDKVIAKVRREDKNSNKENSAGGFQPRSLKELEDMDDDQLFANLDARIAAKTAEFPPKNDDKEDDLYAGQPKDAEATGYMEGEFHSAGGPLTTADRGIISEPDLEFGLLKAGAEGNTEGLAVAIAIEEEDEDIFIPAAVEYDPDAKPPLHKRRRFRLYACLAFLVIVAIAVGAAVLETSMQPDLLPETAAPTSYRESFGIRDAVTGVVGNWVLRDPTSPYAKALDWITFEDPLQLTPEAPSFMQRYLLAYFYYATTVDGPWRTCNPPAAMSDPALCMHDLLGDDRPLFLDAYSSNPSSSWLSTANECSWAGIKCDEQDQVTELDLAGAGLSGRFPEGIYRFPFLSKISFTGNKMRGPLPVKLAQMPHLRILKLAANAFTGTIPSEWWSARQLQHIDLGENNGISGTLSTEIGNLRDLKDLWLGANLISGTIPSEIGLLDNLLDIDLGRNLLRGTIPSEIQGWKEIDEIRLDGNELTGHLPDVFSNLTTMQELHVGSNALTGTLPDTLFDAKYLQYLSLSDNGFTGTISPKIGNFKDSLWYVWLSYNQFTGTLPSEISQLVQLDLLWLQGTDLTGSFPEDFCQLKGNSYVLNDIQADCTADASGKVEFECSCCTICCKAGGSSCFPVASGS